MLQFFCNTFSVVHDVAAAAAGAAADVVGISRVYIKIWKMFLFAIRTMELTVVNCIVKLINQSCCKSRFSIYRECNTHSSRSSGSSSSYSDDNRPEYDYIL